MILVWSWTRYKRCLQLIGRRSSQDLCGPFAHTAHSVPVKHACVSTHGPSHPGGPRETPKQCRLVGLSAEMSTGFGALLIFHRQALQMIANFHCTKLMQNILTPRLPPTRQKAAEHPHNQLQVTRCQLNKEKISKEEQQYFSVFQH